MSKGKLAKATKEHYTLLEIERGLRNTRMLYTYAERGDMDAVNVIIDAERALGLALPTVIQMKTVDLYWRQGKTLAETGKVLGVSAQAVRFNLGLLKVKLQRILDTWIHRELEEEKEVRGK